MMIRPPHFSSFTKQNFASTHTPTDDIFLWRFLCLISLASVVKTEKKNIFGWNKPEQFGLMLFKASSHTTVRIWYENDSFRWRRWQRVKCLILSLSLTQCSTSLLNFIISASEEGKKFFKKKKMLKNFSYSNN